MTATEEQDAGTRSVGRRVEHALGVSVTLNLQPDEPLGLTGSVVAWKWPRAQYLRRRS